MFGRITGNKTMKRFKGSSRQWLRPLMALVCLTGSASAAPKSFVLVRDGQPGATIVLAEKPAENASLAALELQRYVRKMSGAELPMATDSQPPSGPLILVGASRLTDKQAGLQIPSG